MSGCACDVPQQPADPRRHRVCGHCSKVIDTDADWAVNDRTHNEWLDRVELTLREAEGWPKGRPAPREWQHFRALALQREQDGRERHGFGYLARDNIQAGAEEASDGINYTYFDTQQAIKHGDQVEWDLVLTAAYHDFMAYKTRLHLRRRQLGSP